MLLTDDPSRRGSGFRVQGLGLTLFSGWAGGPKSKAELRLNERGSR